MNLQPPTNDPQPPTDDPKLPSYECAEYTAKKSEWLFIRDFMATAKGWVNPVQGVHDKAKAACYLPKEEAERSIAWEFRVKQTPFAGRAKQAVTGFANLLTNFSTQDLSPAIASIEDNFDRRGNSLIQFAKMADCFSLAYGIAWMGAEFPSDSTAQNRLEELSQQRKGWGCLYHPLNVINWKTEFFNGNEKITLLVVKRSQSTQSAYGAKAKTLYRVFTPELWVDYEMISPKSGAASKWVAQEVDRGELDGIPIIPYYDGSSLSQFEPPLYSIFDLELRLYRLASDYYSCLHACNRPSPVSIGRITPGQDPGMVPPLVLGSYNEIMIPVGGNFFYAEPTGSALGTTAQSMEWISTQIDRESLQYVGKTGGDTTATEAELSSKTTEGTLIGMARGKESAFQSLFALMNKYHGGGGDGGTILVNRSLLQPKLTVEAIALLYNNGLLSRESSLKQIAMVAPGVTPEEELLKLTQEFQADTANAIAEEDL